MTVRGIVKSLLLVYSALCLAVAAYVCWSWVFPAGTADRIVIPEGFTMREIADRVSTRTGVPSGSFMDACLDMNFLRSIGIDAPSAEGYLFPDTYRIRPGMDARKLVGMMHRRFRDVVAALGAGIDTGRSLNELVTLASIIERESPRDDEKPIIAGVFRNRLAKGMKLQSDPTVRYALGKPKGALTMGDLRHRSRYNTYIHRGLPPAPICSPGRSSLEAALRPRSTLYLYFVSRNDGSHHFSATLDEHQRAVEYFLHGRESGYRDRSRR